MSGGQKMQKFLKAIEPFKKAILLLIILFAGYLIVGKIVPAITTAKANKSPIAKIEATNDKIYKQGSRIKEADFQVTAIHESGDKSKLSADDITLSTDKPAMTGKITKVVVSLKDKKSISTEVKVKNDREKVTEFECGSPKIKNVKAVLYSNGELCFEGNGDILEYDASYFPWMDYEQDDDYPITAISFEKGVTPTSLDNAFKGIDTLEYVKNIPDSVESMSSTFEDDGSLTHVPDLTGCLNLRNMTRTYADCVSLTKIPEIPSSVVNAQEMCQGCTELQNTPDASNAENLTNASGMYQNCKKLTNVSMPPNVQNMDKMFSSCINLKDMPEIPETVKSMSASFEEDSALKTLTVIPKNVEDVTGCLRGCSKVEGMLWIDANPKNYSSFLGDAAVATKVDLQGNSKMLNVLANTSNENDNITVDGKVPDRDINYSDIEIENEE